MPRPGSHKYDIQRAHRRRELEDQGVANDQGADERANRELQKHDEQKPIRQGERGRGPKSEREPRQE